MDEAHERMLNGAAAYKSMILIAGLECEHPPQFRTEPEFQRHGSREHKRLEPVRMDMPDLWDESKSEANHPIPLDGLVFTSEKGNPLHETNPLRSSRLTSRRRDCHGSRSTACDMQPRAPVEKGCPVEPSRPSSATPLSGSPKICTDTRCPRSQFLAAERMQEALG